MNRPVLMATMKLSGHLLLLLLVCCCCSCCSADGFPGPSSAVCADSRMPVVLPEQLAFCGNGGLSCCDPAAHAALREEFQAMDVPESDAACATIVKAILCQRCVPSLFPQQPVNTTTGSSILPPRCASPPPPPTSTAPQPQHDAVCLERLAGGSTTTGYLAMVAHPDGSGRAFLYTRDGKVSLASLPPPGSGAAPQVVAPPFLDLTGRALLLTGLALHPGFAANGRFFVSYACDATASPACGGAAAAGNGSTTRWPCRYQIVVAEFIAKGVDHGMAPGGAPTEVRRVFTTGVPQPADASSNQIFFRPGHGCLYLVLTGNSGDGDEAAFPFLGKIIRLDIDGMAAGKNEPQIFATGLWDPRGCSFDSKRPSYLYCAGVDEQQNEQVYSISNKAANNSTFPSTAMAAVSPIINHGRPTAGDAPSIVGGILYRGPADPFLNGRYVYIYGSSIWAAAETPAGTDLHVYTSARIPKVRCSKSSPVPCAGVAIAGSVVSLGQDNSKDAFIIATGGIYRVVQPGLCGGAPRPRASVTPPEKGARISWLLWVALIISIPGLPSALAIYFFRACLFGSCRGEDEEQATTRTDCSFTCNCCLEWTCCFCGNANDGDGGRGGIDGIELAA